jgi:hypothetical protein
MKELYKPSAIKREKERGDVDTELFCPILCPHFA